MKPPAAGDFNHEIKQGPTSLYTPRSYDVRTGLMHRVSYSDNIYIISGVEFLPRVDPASWLVIQDTFSSENKTLSVESGKSTFFGLNRINQIPTTLEKLIPEALKAATLVMEAAKLAINAMQTKEPDSRFSLDERFFIGSHSFFEDYNHNS